MTPRPVALAHGRCEGVGYVCWPRLEQRQLPARLENLCRRAALSALPAQHGRDVVETVRRLRPMLITLDLALPGKDGWAIVKELQDDEETGEIPILVISAYTRDLDAPLRRRVARVISKPFYITQVVTEVADILTGARKVP